MEFFCSIFLINDWNVLVNKNIIKVKNEGVIVKLSDVLAIAIDDAPGGLAKALTVLTDANVVIEYMYAFIGKADGKAMTVIRVDNEDKAVEALKNGGVALLTTDDISAR